MIPMIDMIKNYKESLKSDGTVIGDIRRNTANELINYTFTEDPDYKIVRILKQDGWHLEDAKYQYHVTQSISSNAVDWYLQFRPGVHYPIGTYVLIPDDDETMPRTFDEEKHFFAESRKKAIEDGRHSRLWFIVDRNYATHFVRYNIVRCNWTFRWIYRGKIQSVIGAIRNANSNCIARCRWKHCNVFLRICLEPLRALIPKQKDEIRLYGMV